MGKTSNGLKAGFIAGIAYGIIAAIFTLIALALFKAEVISAISLFISTRPIYAEHNITAQSLYNLYRVSGSVVAIVGGIILGLFFGYIYAHVKSHLPGSKTVTGGIIIGLIMWIILGLILGAAYAKEYGTSYFEVYAGGSFIAALVFGSLLSSLYNRFENSTGLIEIPVKQAK